MSLEDGTEEKIPWWQETPKAKRRLWREYPLQTDNRKLQGGNNVKVYQRNHEGWIWACTTWKEMSIQEPDCGQLWAQSELSVQAHDRESAVYGTCPWWSTKGQSVKCRFVSSDIDLSEVGSCQISNLIKFFIYSIFLAQEDDHQNHKRFSSFWVSLNN